MVKASFSSPVAWLALGAAALVAVCACSSVSASAPLDGGSAGSGANDGGSGGSANDGGGASTDGGEGIATDGASGALDSGATSDGAPASDGGSSGSASSKLYPLAVGFSWTYDVEPVGAGSVCASGTHVQQVTGTQTVDGRLAFDLVSFCAAAGTSEVAPVGTGDEVDLDYQGSWLVMIDPTLTDGHSWPYFNSSYTWHRETSVTVPAGTYTDCWTAQQNVTYTAYMTYCRGVGMVRSYSSDLTGAGWDAKLTGESF